MDEVAKTITAYDRNCVEFENKFMEYPPYIQQIREFINLLKPGIEVLDLGCGPGNVSRQLLLSGKEFIIKGIDLSEEMIKLARENVPCGDFSCQDIREISFKAQTFDVIFLSFCIVHLTDMELVLLIQKVSNYLRKEGKLYLSFMDGKKDGFERTSFSEDEIYFYYHSSDSVEKLLKANNLSIINLTKQDYPENGGSITTDIFIFAEKL